MNHQDEQHNSGRHRTGFRRFLWILAAVVLLLMLRAGRQSGQKGDIEAQQAQFQEYIQSHFPQEDIWFTSGASHQRAGGEEEQDAGNLTAVRLFRNERYNEWDAFISADMQNDLRIHFTRFEGIRFGADETVYHSGDQIPVWSYNIDMPITIIQWNGDEMALGSIVFFYGAGTPTLYIGSEQNEAGTGNADDANNTDASYLMLDRDGETIADGRLSYQLLTQDRSIAYEQKPYELTLAKDNSRWKLLPSYIETGEQVRAKITVDLAKEMGLLDVPSADFVNVYLDGQYAGLYLLESWPDDTTASDAEDTANRAVNTAQAEASVQTKTWDAFQVPDDPDQMQAQSKTQEDSGDTSLTAWDKLVRLYVLYDYMAVAFPGDYSLTCGHTRIGDYPHLSEHSLWLRDVASQFSAYEENQKETLQTLNDSAAFQQAVKTYYQEEFAPILETYIQDDLPVLTYNVVASGRMSTYHYYQTSITSDTSVWNIRKWIVERKKFMDDYLENPDAYVCLIFKLPQDEAGTAEAAADPSNETDAAVAADNSYTIRYYVRTGGTFGTLPINDNNEGTAYYTDSRKQTSMITGWTFPDGTALTEDTMITEEMDESILTPVTQQAQTGESDEGTADNSSMAQQNAIGENASQ